MQRSAEQHWLDQNIHIALHQWKELAYIVASTSIYIYIYSQISKVYQLLLRTPHTTDCACNNQDQGCNHSHTRDYKTYIEVTWGRILTQAASLFCTRLLQNRGKNTPCNHSSAPKNQLKCHGTLPCMHEWSKSDVLFANAQCPNSKEYRRVPTYKYWKLPNCSVLHCSDNAQPTICVSGSSKIQIFIEPCAN